MEVAQEKRKHELGRRMTDKRSFRVDSWAEVAVVIGLVAHIVVLALFLSKIQTTAVFAQTTAEKAETNTQALTRALHDLETQATLNIQFHEGSNQRDAQQTLVLQELVRIVYSNHPTGQ